MFCYLWSAYDFITEAFIILTYNLNVEKVLEAFILLYLVTTPFWKIPALSFELQLLCMKFRIFPFIYT